MVVSGTDRTSEWRTLPAPTTAISWGSFRPAPGSLSWRRSLPGRCNRRLHREEAGLPATAASLHIRCYLHGLRKQCNPTVEESRLSPAPGGSLPCAQQRFALRTAQVGNAATTLSDEMLGGQPANGVIVDSHEAGLQTGDGAVDQNIGRFALLYSFENIQMAWCLREAMINPSTWRASRESISLASNSGSSSKDEITT